MRVIWTNQAFERLAEIEDYIATDSLEAAIALTARLIARAQDLAQFPAMGRRIQELPGSDLRELVEGNYRIACRQRSKVIEILTVFEAHRLFPEDDLDP